MSVPWAPCPRNPSGPLALQDEEAIAASKVGV